MPEKPELQSKLADLVTIEYRWVPPELTVEIERLLDGYGADDDFWELSPLAKCEKSERGPGVPLVHWFNRELNEQSKLVAGDVTVPSCIEKLAKLVEVQFGIHANSVQVNLYESGYGLVWHSDENAAQPMTGDKTVTVRFGAMRLFAVGAAPEAWGKRRLQLSGDPSTEVEPIDSWVLASGDCAAYDNELHEHWVHAVLPDSGDSYGITFRQY